MKTRITEMLGIEHPVIQSGMIFVSFVPLVAAVCEAGGLGIMTSGEQSVEQFRQNIRRIRELTDKPFGVNLVPYIPGYRQLAEVTIEEQVPIFCHGYGNPFRILGVEKPPGMILMPTVGSVGDAIKMEQQGADALIVCGSEGGGHVGYISSMVLIPQVADKVKIPFVAAGGFCDGRGLAAALSLGAEGICMGTRFASTQESPIAENAKKMYVESQAKDARLSYKYDGLRLRSVVGPKMKNYKGWWTQPQLIPSSVRTMKKSFGVSTTGLVKVLQTQRRMKRPIMQTVIGGKMFRETLYEGKLERAVLPAGQVVGRIDDIPTCKELIDRIVREAEQTIGSLNTKV